MPGVERAVVDSGVVLLKYWLEVSPEEQTRRLQSRIDDPRKVWKLSELDLLSYTRWREYSRARDDMFAATDTEWAPWFVVNSDDKKRARLNVITHLLAQVPYEPLPRRKVVLPKRKVDSGDVDTGRAAALDPHAVLTCGPAARRSSAGGDHGTTAVGHRREQAGWWSWCTWEVVGMAGEAPERRMTVVQASLHRRRGDGGRRHLRAARGSG